MKIENLVKAKILDSAIFDLHQNDIPKIIHFYLGFNPKKKK